MEQSTPSRTTVCRTSLNSSTFSMWGRVMHPSQELTLDGRILRVQAVKLEGLAVTFLSRTVPDPKTDRGLNKLLRTKMYSNIQIQQVD